MFHEKTYLFELGLVALCSSDDFCLSPFMITPNDLACCTSEVEFREYRHYRSITITYLFISICCAHRPQAQWFFYVPNRLSTIIIITIMILNVESLIFASKNYHDKITYPSVEIPTNPKQILPIYKMGR